MKLSTKILIGLVLGLATGVFFGEPAGSLRIIGETFIGLLQMTVLPYVMVSLIAGLGRLEMAEARRLAARGGLILLTLWGVALATVAIFPLAFPTQESASFFSTAMIAEREPFDFLGLYIPSNPFHSMANTIMPAVVLFSIAVGIALIGMDTKQRVIEQLEVWSGALMRITKAVTKLAPYGVFAIAASAAGTMAVEDAGRLQVFLVTYVLAACVMAFWVLPALVTALTPIEYRHLMANSREAIVTAFATGNLLVVLPMLAQGAKDALAAAGHSDEESRRLVDVLTPTSFTFPHSGKLLGLAFVPFVGWFVGTPVPYADFPTMLTAGLAALFGHIVVAIPFLLKLLGLPDDMFQLFLSVDVFIKSFRMLVAATHTLAFTLLATFAMQGKLQVQWRRIGQIGVATLALMIAIFGGARVLFTQTLGTAYDKDEVLANMEFIAEPVETAVVHKTPPPAPAIPSDPRPSRLTLIRNRGVIRIGYFPDHLPYSYFNAKGELIGLDVEMAHILARDLNLRPEFVPADPDRLAEQLYNGYCDIVMSGVVVTPERAQEMMFTVPVLEGTLGFLVTDARRDEFRDAESVQRFGASTKIGIWNLTYYMVKLRAALPEVEIVPVSTSQELQSLLESGDPGFDAFLMPAEEAAAWSMYYPRFSVAIPTRSHVRAPLAYALDQDAETMQDLLNTWVRLKRSDGTVQRLYDHWILGRWAVKTEPRWSVLRNVLGFGADSPPSATQ